MLVIVLVLRFNVAALAPRLGGVAVVGGANVRSDDWVWPGSSREWKTLVTLLLHWHRSDHLGALLCAGLIALGLRGLVADSLRVAGLGWHLTAGLGVTSAVVALSLVDLDTLLVHLAVLVVCCGALLVIHRGALLEHLLLHHHHGELSTLLTLHLLGLQRNSSRNMNMDNKYYWSLTDSTLNCCSTDT